MAIVYASKQLDMEDKDTRKMLYKLQNGNGNISFKNAVDQLVEVKLVVILSDKNNDGQEVELTALVDMNDTVYIGNSSTVQRDITKMINTIGTPDENDPLSVIIRQGETKAGKTFSYLELV